MDVKDCGCTACVALLAECGPEHFEMYRKKLLIRGWAGSVTPVEKAYQKAHSDWAGKSGRTAEQMRAVRSLSRSGGALSQGR